MTQNQTLTTDEQVALDALSEALNLTDECDWHLFHMTVAQDLEAGKYSAAFEAAYKAMVNEKADARQLP